MWLQTESYELPQRITQPGSRLGDPLMHVLIFNLGSHAHIISYHCLFICVHIKIFIPHSPFSKDFLLKFPPITAHFLCIAIFILPCLCGNPGNTSKIGWRTIINRGASLDSTCSIAEVSRHYICLVSEPVKKTNP